MSTVAIANPLSARSRAGWLLAWVMFWLLLATVSVQDYLRIEGGQLWRPVLWEGTSCLVATVMLGALWQYAPRYDSRLTQPARWFALQLRWLPLLAPLFVTLVYALRHAVYALLGQTYGHQPWGQVYLYECTKFALFFMLFTAIVFGVRTHAALAEARLRTQAAQLAQLTQQLEPHFLFNALNTIAATVHDKPDLADSLLTRLAALLRATTDLTRRPSCTLDEELRLVDGYAAIMCERFADRVTLRVDVDADARGCRVPTLAIQPLLENAFRHGVERSSEATALTLRAQRRGDRLRVEVEQSRGDVDADAAAGVGLGTLRERLARLGAPERTVDAARQPV
ncbi:MAG TPA: histidine kinase, partial [Burkholderiaceae bacterium]|nr:histidine kinase [Burkholderiaceae bacterium]